MEPRNCASLDLAERLAPRSTEYPVPSCRVGRLAGLNAAGSRGTSMGAPQHWREHQARPRAMCEQIQCLACLLTTYIGVSKQGRHMDLPIIHAFQ